MGCDGGTIPKRDELVRTKKKPEEKDKEAELAYRWGHCTITQEPLAKPIVACQLGRLYNKVTVLEALLDKTAMPKIANHIKSIKDIKEVIFTDNPAYAAKAKTSETYDESLFAQYICPVTGLEMNGKFRFVFFWSCGCAISERAYKEVKVTQCHKCQKPIDTDDVIVLNGSDDDIDAAKINMLKRKAAFKANKKADKIALKKVGNDILTAKGPESSTPDLSKPSGSKVIESKVVSGKRPAQIDLTDPQFKKTKNEYSVAKDPKATAVYKSLFTTHESATKQNRAHWVTYNPFYN